LYFVVRARCRRKESSRSLSHLLMSFLSIGLTLPLQTRHTVTPAVTFIGTCNMFLLYFITVSLTVFRLFCSKHYSTLKPRLLSYIQQSSWSAVQLQSCNNEVEFSWVEG